MANEDGQRGQDQGGTETGTDYKALWEKAKAEADQAKADAEKWKGLSRKNESRAKSNADAAKTLEGAEQQMQDLARRLAAIEGENATLKAEKARLALVAKVAADTGVPEAIVSSLAANDEETLTAAATTIAEAYKQPGGAPAANEAGTHVNTAATGTTNAQAFGAAIAKALSK